MTANEKPPLNYLEIAFPGQSEAIARQRDTDAVFDEICRDFEEIAAAVTELNSKDVSVSTDRINDLTVSLEGLHEEIAEYRENSFRDGL